VTDRRGAVKAQLERLLFLQGNQCFFCEGPIPEGQASVEHLCPRSAGGSNADDNCVVCCKTLNAMLGSLPVKAKLQAVLRHRGSLRCPAKAVQKAAIDVPNTIDGDSAGSDAVLLAACIDNLRKRGDKRPASLATLRNALKAAFPAFQPARLEDVLQMLRDTGEVVQEGTRVRYPKMDKSVAH
jgi:hypothetical protein